MEELHSPLKAIRAKCIDCSAGQLSEVRDCPNEKCALYSFRMGKNPYHTKKLSEEQRKKLSENAKKNLSKSPIDL